MFATALHRAIAHEACSPLLVLMHMSYKTCHNVHLLCHTLAHRPLVSGSILLLVFALFSFAVIG